MSLGPLTTTFAPPADCVASSALYWVNTASTFYWLHGQPLQTSCFPDNYSPYQNQYYSPGICPVGYTRACESRSASETRATCCPQGNYVCASTSSSYSYPWGPTLGCMSVYRVDTETSFTTIDGTPTGGETAGTPMSIYAPGTIMAYGIVIRNSQTAATTTAAAMTTQTSGSASDTLQTASSALASETASSSVGAAAAGETQASSSGNGGLSTGAAAGIGIATAVGIMAIGGVALWMFWTRRRKRKQQQQQQQREAEAEEQQQHARGATGMSNSPEAWSETTWSTTPATALTYPHQQPAIQVNWQPTELANEREPREMSAEGRLLPVEKDGRGFYWR